MPDYAAQVPVDDRWAIIAYIRALQLSQRAPLADLPDTPRNSACWKPEVLRHDRCQASGLAPRPSVCSARP